MHDWSPWSLSLENQKRRCQVCGAEETRHANGQFSGFYPAECKPDLRTQPFAVVKEYLTYEEIEQLYGPELAADIKKCVRPVTNKP